MSSYSTKGSTTTSSFSPTLTFPSYHMQSRLADELHFTKRSMDTLLYTIYKIIHIHSKNIFAFWFLPLSALRNLSLNGLPCTSPRQVAFSKVVAQVRQSAPCNSNKKYAKIFFRFNIQSMQCLKCRNSKIELNGTTDVELSGVGCTDTVCLMLPLLQSAVKITVGCW